MQEKGSDNPEKSPDVKLPEDIYCKQTALESMLEETDTFQNSCIAIALKSKIRDFDKIPFKPLSPYKLKSKRLTPFFMKN